MHLPTSLLASLRVGLGATALLGSACAASPAARGPAPFPGAEPTRRGDAPVHVVPVAPTTPVARPVAQPLTPVVAVPPDRPGWDCVACGMG